MTAHSRKSDAARGAGTVLRDASWNNLYAVCNSSNCDKSLMHSRGDACS